ncbi:hypothetical protein FB451DRAFT_326645 [Mycena latifolia]|nr:hypothetical protein FB451DRAFT_326645 [Mycena latifolia]
MYTPRTYLDDTLIVTNIENRFIRRTVFEYFLERLDEILADDLEHHRCELVDLGYLTASRAADERILPVLEDVVKQFAADLEALANKRRALPDPSIQFNGSPYSISLASLDSAQSDDSLIKADAPDLHILPTPAVDRLPSKPIPYHDKVVLPPVEIPDGRRGPKLKTRGSADLARVPAAVAPAVPDIIPLPARYPVPGDIYDVFERIFSPTAKGKVTFADLKRVMTCKEIGFTYESRAGARRGFKPPVDGLPIYVIHEPHGSKDLNVNYVRGALNELYGWTMGTFVLMAGKRGA